MNILILSEISHAHLLSYANYIRFMQAVNCAASSSV